MRRRDPEPDAELEALDPITGERLLDDAATSSAAVGTATEARRVAVARRAQRFRTARFAFLVLAIGCAASAAYFGVTIRQLREVERTWRTAIAADLARADADRQVLDTLEEVEGDDEHAATGPLGTIGDEVTRTLATAERSLADRRILDSKVSDLRDQMVEALRFRRFQLTPQRAQMGDTPLRKVDLAIDTQLDRWGLEPIEVDAPELRSLAGVLDGLRRFTDEPTGTTLFATTDDLTLITIDVDGSLARGRRVPRPVLRLLPAPGGVAVFDAVEVTVYPADVDAAPIAQVPASRHVFEAGDGTGDLWVVEAVPSSSAGTGTAVRRFRPTAGEALQAPFVVPAGRNAVGAAGGRVVLVDERGGLQLWTPATGEITVVSTDSSRFLDGDRERLLWQGPLPFGDPDSDGYLHLYEVESERRELMALPPTDAATADLAPDGTVAIAAGPLAGRLGSILVARAGTAALTGVDGPRASLRGDAVHWSDDGRTLFWLTPDGRIALRHGSTRDAEAATMRSGLAGLERMTILGR